MTMTDNPSPCSGPTIPRGDNPRRDDEEPPPCVATVLGSSSESNNNNRNRSTSSSPSSSNPAIILARKLCASHNSHNEEDSTFLLNFSKDLIAGTFLAALFLLVLLVLLCYGNIMPLGSARAVRRAASQMMADAETIQYVEESLEMKFIPMDVYIGVTLEKMRLQKTVDDKQREWDKHDSQIEERKKELKSMQAEYDELVNKAQGLFHLIEFCEECKWQSSGISCKVRMDYMINTHRTSEFSAKIELMKSGGCRKSV